MEYDYVGIGLLFGLFFVLMVLRTPIAFALAIPAVVTAVYSTGSAGSLRSLFDNITKGLSGEGLMAIPFFILAGEIMSAGSISRRLIDLATAVVGRFRGGLASVNILASMFFGGVSGSSVADTSSVGSILIPMMKKRGYDTEFAVGVTITGSTQGIIIPPSHNAIIFAAAFAYPHIDRLFIGGVIPGVMVGLALMVTAYVMARRRGYPSEPAVRLLALPGVFVRSLPALMTAVIIVGGILRGWFTANEAAVVAVVYAFLLTFAGYRDVRLREMAGILARSLRIVGMVMFLIGSAAAFGWLMTLLQVPQLVTDGLLRITDDPTGMKLVIVVLLLGLGCIMDMAPLILITTPILKPVVLKIGMDPVHFGIVMLLALGIGLVTPPVGSTLFVGCAIGGTTIERMSRTLWPFYFTMLGVLLLVTFVPELSLWLPRMMRG